MSRFQMGPPVRMHADANGDSFSKAGNEHTSAVYSSVKFGGRDAAGRCYFSEGRFGRGPRIRQSVSRQLKISKLEV